MALITYDHAPKFVSFDPRADMSAIGDMFPFKATVLADAADTALFGHVRGMHAWCCEYCKGKYCRHWEDNHAVFHFEVLEDALLFKLTWA